MINNDILDYFNLYEWRYFENLDPQKRKEFISKLTKFGGVLNSSQNPDELSIIIFKLIGKLLTPYEIQ